MKNISNSKRILAVIMAIGLFVSFNAVSAARQLNDQPIVEEFITAEFDNEIPQRPTVPIDEATQAPTEPVVETTQETTEPTEETTKPQLPPELSVLLSFEESNSLLAGTARLAHIPASLGVEWRSSDESVLRIEDTYADFGVDATWIIAVNVGEAVLQAVLPDGTIFEQNITVLPRPDILPRPDGFLATPHVVRATVGEYTAITLSNAPDDGAFFAPDILDWISSDESVAVLGSEFDENQQQNFFVYGLSPGRTVMTLLLIAQATEEDTDAAIGYYSIEVIVAEPENNFTRPPVDRPIEEETTGGFWQELTTALVEPPAEIAPMCGGEPVTRVEIGVRAANQRRGRLTNGGRRPFTLYYNNPSHADGTVWLHANITPTNATNQRLSWRAVRVLDSANLNPPTPLSSTEHSILVRGGSTRVPEGRFIREYIVTTECGNHTDSQIIIGAAHNGAATMPVYTALRTVNVFSGPYSTQQATFPIVGTLQAGAQIHVRAQYNDNWHFVRYGNDQWGYVQLRTAGNFAPSPDIRWPSDGHFVNTERMPWGWRTHPISGNAQLHRGVDIHRRANNNANNPNTIGGTPVRSITAGTVFRFAYEVDGRGHFITVEHNIPGRGLYSSSYAHLQSAGLIAAGTPVTAGQQIGRAGTSGGSTGDHLHFEFWRGNRNQRDTSHINPINLYASRDRRTTASNPQPLFRLVNGQYQFNPNFDWNYSGSPLPSRFSHNASYRLF